MANIMDYMDWRGDLSFEADEFNEVDNLILAQLAYVDVEGIVTAEENAPAVPLKEASGQFWEKNDKDEILARVSMTKSAPFVMEKMAETKRFSDVKLRCYVNEIRDFVTEGQQVRVKAIGTNPQGKISLSRAQNSTDSAVAEATESAAADRPVETAMHPTDSSPVRHAAASPMSGSRKSGRIPLKCLSRICFPASSRPARNACAT